MDLNAALQNMINAAVDERIGQVRARGDAMAALHGEYVKVKDAARIMNVSANTIRRMVQDGRLEGCSVGISTRSIAELPLRSGAPAKAAASPSRRGKALTYERILP